jgi:hypothetical protein
MGSRFRVLLYALTIVSLTLVSAFTVIPARADDGAPPPPASSAAPVSAAAHTPADISKVPAGTDVVVVNRSGHKVALATQEASRIVAAGDPVWCPTGVLPGSPLCSWFSRLDLLAAGPAPTGNGVIWIEEDAADPATTASTINGTGTWSAAADFSLAFKGGWTGSGAGLIDPSHFSTFGVPLTIENWNADVTLSDITFSGVTSGTALSVTTSGKITLTNMSVDNTAGAGAYLDNSPGTSDVIVTSGKFYENTGGSGLSIVSNGAISLSNITALNNKDFGAILSNAGTGGLKPVSVTGWNQFNFNGTGLYITSSGAVTLHNIAASWNTNTYGLYVNTTTDHLAPQNVTLTGFGTFDNNKNSGLEIYTYGAITLPAITANNNGNYGAFLNNYGDLSNFTDPAHFATLPKGVTITGAPDADFNGNQFDGLDIISFGTITLNGVDANGNQTDGAMLTNDFTGSTGGITFGGWGASFSDNKGGYGLNATTKGAITGTGLWAWNNTSYGALLGNNDTLIPKPVTINGAFGTTYGYNGSGSGLIVYSMGAITLNKLGADGNSGAGTNGVYLNNSYLGAVGGITLTGSAEFGNNTVYGLDAYSNGAITLNNVDAGNNGIGVRINGGPGAVTFNGNNNIHDNRDTGLQVTSTGNLLLHNMDVHGNGTDNVVGHGDGAVLSATGNVAVSGYGNFHENYFNGLVIYSSGTVTLSNINASNNGFDKLGTAISGYGVYIANSSAGTAKAVTLTGNNGLYHNTSDDLYVTSRGAITVSNLEANDSVNGIGAELDNTSGQSSSPQNVTITGYGHFYNNDTGGLSVYSYGAITLAKIDENGNDTSTGSGIYLDNTSGTIAKPVMISGFINANNNHSSHGLYVASLGAITLANLNVDRNAYGAYLDNCRVNLGACTGPVAPAAVTITGNLYTTNSIIGYGLVVLSKGAITFTLGNSWNGWNNDFGWLLDNHNTGAVGGITLSAAKFNDINFDSNGSYGLQALSLGNIKITNLDAYNNGRIFSGYGVLLSNALPGSAGTVTLLTTGGNSNFNSNNGDGLDVSSNRAISITSLHTDSNTGIGASLDNSSSGKLSPQNVTLVGSNSFNNNGSDGLDILSFGVITLGGVDAYSNGQTNFYNQAHALPIDPTSGWGVQLSNCGSTITCAGAMTPKAVTLYGTNNMSNNFLGGLWVYSLGAIKLNQVNAGNNGTDGDSGGAYLNDGVYLNNQWAGAVGGITITTTFPTWTNSFNNNGFIGLEALSNGALTLSSIFAEGNTMGGAYLDNCAINPLTGCTVASGAVTLTGRNRFNNNGDLTHPADGLDIFTGGAITINNLIATGNFGNGAWLDNCGSNGLACTRTANITLTGLNDFSKNNTRGLRFNSGGNVSMTSVTADNNNTDGIFGQAVGSITVTCGSANNNHGGYGLDLTSPAITLIHVIATGNSVGPINASTLPTIIRTCPLP